MSKTFVAINDSVHGLVRGLTRKTPLCPGPAESGARLLQYAIRQEELPETYYSLAMLHGVGGMPLGVLLNSNTRLRVKVADRAAVAEQVNYFDIAKLDKRCARDLRFKLKKQGPGMLAAELLAYGTGVLRANNDDPDAPLHQYLWGQHGRLHSDHEEVYATIRALHPHSYLPQGDVGKESFDSTNLIYGDAYGEVEQIWDRRRDTPFLELVVQNLQRLRREQEIAAFLNPPLNVEAVMWLHLQRQALWITPPPGVSALLRRVEFILESTIVDDQTRTVFSRSELVRQPQPKVPSDPTPEWKSDRTGYDGWLK